MAASILLRLIAAAAAATASASTVSPPRAAALVAAAVREALEAELASCTKEELIQRVLQGLQLSDGHGRATSHEATQGSRSSSGGRYPLVRPVALSSGQWAFAGVPLDPANHSEKIEPWSTAGRPVAPTAQGAFGDSFVDDKDGNSFAFLTSSSFAPPFAVEFDFYSGLGWTTCGLIIGASNQTTFHVVDIPWEGQQSRAGLLTQGVPGVP
jgi:hypothetical protein